MLDFSQGALIRSAVMNTPTQRSAGISKYHVHGRPIPTPMATHTGNSSRLTPTSTMSRQKIVAANCCWP
jgi:hypothetical protein